MSRLLNAIGFQAGWWAAVGGAGLGLETRGLEAAGLLLCLLLAWLHLRMCPEPARELRLAGVALVLGMVIDSLLQQAGVIRFHGFALGPLSPLWLWMLWVLFAMTLNSSMAFFQGWHWAVSALAGGIFGPLSYLAGAKLGAATFDATPWHLAAIGLAWMVAMPWLVKLAMVNTRMEADKT